ncbi:hypothetical protein [Streptomyces sp. NPDC093984]
MRDQEGLFEVEAGDTGMTRSVTRSSWCHVVDLAGVRDRLGRR